MSNLKLLLIGIPLWITSCSSNRQTEIELPETLSDGWEVEDVSNQGFNKKELAHLIHDIPDQNPRLDAVVIARNGKLVVDEYFNDYAPDKLHKVWSITKAISGTALGIAIDKDYLQVNDSIYDWLREYASQMNDSARSIQVEHLITMTSGIKWVNLGGPGSSGFELPYSTDWISFILKQDQIASPGKVFNYGDPNTLLLAPVMKNATGMQVKEFATLFLFEPLGIRDFEWDKQSEFWQKTQGGELPGAKIPTDLTYEKPFADLTNTASGLRMRPRDMCKIGQLYLNEGEWNGAQIVSKEWIKASVAPHFGNEEFGYHWRLGTINDQPCYYATGFGLQSIYVIPALELVIVLTQHHYESMPQGNELTQRLLSGILNSIES